MARERFQFDRRLGFVGHLVTHSEERRDRIEQPATTRSLDGADAPLDHFGEDASAFFAQKFARPRVGDFSKESQHISCRNSRRVANRRVTARQRQVLEMREPAKAEKIGDHCLAAPDSAVGAVARTVEGETYRRSLMAMLGHARDEVSVMVLNGNGAHAQVRSEFARRRLGMKIVGGDARFDAGQGKPFVEGIAKMILGRDVFKRADVLAHEGLPARQETEAVFEIAADSENRNRCLDRSRQCARCRAAAKPDRLSAMWSGRPDTIVAALMNRPIVQQQRVHLPANAARASSPVHASGSPGKLALVMIKGRPTSCTSN